MMPAANKGVGGDFCFPDVCKTPAGPAVVPIPYPCLGFNAMAAPFSVNVFWSMVPALNQLSIIPLSAGMEPGALGGAITGIIKGMMMVTMGNPIVFVNMAPAKNLLSMVAGNLHNAMLGFTLIPSLTNVLLTCDAPELPAAARSATAGSASHEERGSEVTADMVRPLAQRLAGEPDRLDVFLDDAGTAHLRIDVMGRAVSNRVFNALDPLRAGIRRLEIDLRGNPGGDARAALELADDFVPRGTLLAVRVDHDGDSTELCARHDVAYPWPVTLLVDEGTASAAELFVEVLAAAGADVRGGPTRGKLTAQRVLVDDRGASRYETVARFQPHAR